MTLWIEFVLSHQLNKNFIKPKSTRTDLEDILEMKACNQRETCIKISNKFLIYFLHWEQKPNKSKILFLNYIQVFLKPSF